MARWSHPDDIELTGDDLEKSRESKRHLGRKKHFPVFLCIYGVVLIVLAILAVKLWDYTDDALVQYEASQPEYAMNAFIQDFRSRVSAGVLDERMAFPPAQSAFEDPDTYRQDYLAGLQAASEITYAVDESLVSGSTPRYDILCDGAVRAKVQLKPVRARVLLAILTVTDWEVDRVDAVYDVTVEDYTITIPRGFTAYVNGTALTDEYRTGEHAPNPKYDYISQYVAMPVLLDYRIEGLAHRPLIEVSDSTGIMLDKSQDERGDLCFTYDEMERLLMRDIPEDRYRQALEYAQVWDSFSMGELGGRGNNYGVGTVRKYIIKDSYYWQATSKQVGAAVGYVTKHTVGDPPYDNIEVTDYIPYTDDCYSCRVKMDKNIVLESGAKKVSTIDETIYIVCYDDSDDGIDNPRWLIADMLPTTQE